MKLLSAVLAAVTGVGLAAVWSGPAGAAPGPAHPPNAAAAARYGPASTVRLITGDLVTVRGADGGRAVLTVEPRERTGLAAQFVSMHRGGEQFLFPAAALPYLNHGLDPALFDVTRLARAGLNGPDARLAVRLTYQAGAAHRAIPGVTVTRTQGDTAEGYLTAASARAFGAALVAQAGADRQHPASRGLGMFAGLTGISWPLGPSATPLAPPTQPGEQLVTLRIKVIGESAKPVSQASIVGLNTDDFNRGFVFTEATNGEAEADLPPGNYGFIVASNDPETNITRVVNVVDYVLTAQGGPVQTLTIDMRTANQSPSASTPRPAGFASLVTNFLRADRNGAFVGIDNLTFDEQTPILVAPAPAARIGKLSYTADLQYVSPAGTPVPYAYSLAFGGQEGVPANLHFNVTEADLATINNTYYTDGSRPQPGSTEMFSFLPWQDLASTADFPFTTPGRRIDYVTGRGDAEWHASYRRDAVDDAGHSVPGAELYVDSARRYDAGQQVQVDWGRQPIHPALAVETAKSVTQFRCPACREDDRMRIRLEPLNDSAGHLGGGDGFRDNTPLGPRDTTGRQQLFAGDTKIGEESGGEFEVAVPAGSTRYRLLLDQNRIAPWVSTGVRSHTEWGFTSAHPTASTMPSTWRCGSIFEPPPVACAVLPLLTANYAAPVDTSGVAPGGPTHLGVTVAPTQAASATTITSIAVDVSFDDGATWTPTTVTGTGGRYDAAFTAPTSGFVTTRVQATDSAGDTISQTITRAYALGPAA